MDAPLAMTIALCLTAILAQVTPAPVDLADWITKLTNLGATGVLAWLLVWFLKTYLPARDKAAEDERNRIAERHIKERADAAAAVAVNSTNCGKQMERLHDEILEAFRDYMSHTRNRFSEQETRITRLEGDHKPENGRTEAELVQIEAGPPRRKKAPSDPPSH